MVHETLIRQYPSITSHMEVLHHEKSFENDFLKVTIDDHGAELVSIYDKEKDREVIWQEIPGSGDVMRRFFFQM